tara:strand:- start:665 stop:901 length:237 start_codon:yes stop_codon:yes gene_type:complete
MQFNIFGIDFDLSVTSIIQFILDNKAALIPGVLYLIFNQLISPYIIIGIIGIFFIVNQMSHNNTITNELNKLKEKITK